jgi:hypothetical protein
MRFCTVYQASHGNEGTDGVMEVVVLGVAGSITRKIPFKKPYGCFESSCDRVGVEVGRSQFENDLHFVQHSIKRIYLDKVVDLSVEHYPVPNRAPPGSGTSST